jgi:hypothetical protein
MDMLVAILMVSRNGLANKAGSNQSEGLGVHLADFSIGGPGEIWVGEPKGSKIVVSNWWSMLGRLIFLCLGGLLG